MNCDILKSLNILNIEHRVKQMRLNYVFNIVHDKAPLYMKNSFTLVSSSFLNTRPVGNMNFTIPIIKSCQDQTFYYNAIKDWNALPSSIKQLNNKYSFKTNVKQHLMDSLRQHEKSSYVYL